MIFKKFLELPKKMQLEMLFYSIFMMYRMPLAWIKSLWEARILLNGQWSRYMGFHPRNAINNLFYRTQWINLDRYGRTGNSPVIGLGSYPLKNWFHLSLSASYVYANAGAVTTLVSTLAWVFGHLLWLESVENKWWVISVVAALFFSSTSYAMAFVRQNYQMLGWMWLPLAMYFSYENSYVLAAFAWVAAGLAGITPVFFAIPIILTISFLNQNGTVLLVVFPAMLCSAFRFLPLLMDGGLRQALTNVAKVIGATQRMVRYKRSIQGINFFTLYFSILYLICFGLMSVSIGEIATFPLLSLMLFFFNQRFVRLADEQSLIVIAASSFTFTAIHSEPSWLNMIALWLVLNPLGFLFSIQRLSKDGSGDGNILIFSPFDQAELEKAMNSFFEQVSRGDRVYFAYEDPGDNYSNIFDGYRSIHELPLLVASQNEFHLFPDWWTVAETNYEGAPQCWGRSLDDVIRNCQRWNARYTMIYQESGSRLDEKWNGSFELISEFDWCDYQHLSECEQLWSKNKPTPKWFLLRYRNGDIGRV